MSRHRLLALLTVAVAVVPVAAVPVAAVTSTGAAPARSGYALRKIPDFSYPTSPGNVTERWDPCTAVRYAVNLSGAPKGALAEVRTAVAALAKATGIAFVYKGTTAATSHSVPDPNGGLQLDAAPLVKAKIDLLIEWQAKGTPHSLLALAADPAGIGLTIAGGSWSQTGTGASAVLTRHPTRITQAVIALDKGQNAKLTAKGRDASGDGLRELLLHELGHAVGLEHPSEGGQIMDPVLKHGGPTAYAPGDRAGLTLVGKSAGCLPATVVTTGAP